MAWASDHSKTLTFGQRTRKYLIHLPPDYETQKKYPCVIVLHGAAADCKLAQHASCMNEVADQNRFIAVYPNGTGLFSEHGLSWNGGDCCGYARKKQIDDIGFLNALIDSLESSYSIDRNRVYLAGFSNGGMLAMAAAPRLNSKIAAIAVVAASMSGKETKSNTPVPIVFFHGTRDKRVSYTGGPGRFAKFGLRVNDKPLAYAVNFWRDVNHCSNTAQVERTNHVIKEDYWSADKSGEVLVFTIVNGGHGWPGGKRSGIRGAKPPTSVDASVEMYKFFARHALNAGQALSSVP